MNNALKHTHHFVAFLIQYQNREQAFVHQHIHFGYIHKSETELFL